MTDERLDVEVLWSQHGPGTIVKFDGVAIPSISKVEISHDASACPVLRLEIPLPLVKFSTGIRR